jgi:hypothetical protein
MTDKKISQLANATTPLAGTEVLPIVQSGSTVKVSVDNLTAGKTVKATTFDTDVAAAKVTLTGTTLAASGTDTDISVTITPKGSGSLSTSKLSASGDVSFDGGAFVFNDSGADKDFRVEGDTQANLLFVDASADRVGFGTNTPTHRVQIDGAAPQLSISGTAGSGYRGLVLIDNNGTKYNFFIGAQNNVNDAFEITPSTAAGGTTFSNPAIVITSGSEVWVAGTTDQGAYNLQCNGTGVWGAGAYVNGSDERIKEDIAPIASSLDVVEKLKPVTYRYKESWSKDQSVQTGFIAQELLTALENEVYVDGVVQQGGAESYYSVAYQNIIPILTKAIQELKAELDVTKAKVAALESK